ncbi:MAG: ABC transporter ATP-binding protein, partial [Pseudomonadota bacterium]
MLFRSFERMVDPYPEETLTKPPGSLWSFIWHYARPFKWLFLASIIFSAGIALIEVFAFELVGNIVDWATTQGAEGFWESHGGQVLLICGLIAIVWPIASLIDELILLQGILGNMAMQIRWRGHRYLLRQSNTFFANDFAGRISTKLMQSALGVRDVCVKLSNLFVYMGVYFLHDLERDDSSDSTEQGFGRSAA